MLPDPTNEEPPDDLASGLPTPSCAFSSNSPSVFLVLPATCLPIKQENIVKKLMFICKNEKKLQNFNWSAIIEGKKVLSNKQYFYLCGNEKLSKNKN